MTMVTGIIGKKVGMTQLFAPDGTVQPVTVIKAGPCVVVQAKTVEKDGYQSVQLGFVEDKPAKVTKPVAGTYKKAGVPPTRVRREVKLAKGADVPKAGEQVLVSAVFKGGERVDVIGRSRGHGVEWCRRAIDVESARHPVRAPGGTGAVAASRRVRGRWNAHAAHRADDHARRRRGCTARDGIRPRSREDRGAADLRTRSGPDVRHR